MLARLSRYSHLQVTTRIPGRQNWHTRQFLQVGSAVQRVPAEPKKGWLELIPYKQRLVRILIYDQAGFLPGFLHSLARIHLFSIILEIIIEIHEIPLYFVPIYQRLE